MSHERLDNSTTLEEIKNIVKDFVHRRGWERYHAPKNLALSISIEAAELMELFQWKSEDEIKELVRNSKEYVDRIKEELADVIIYSLSFSNALNIDIATTVKNKLVINAKKYPA